MAGIGICRLFLWLIVIPAAVGSVFYNPYKGIGKIAYDWVSGQFFLWAVFFLVSVPMILSETDFMRLVYGYRILTVVILLFTAVYWTGKIWGREKITRFRLVKGSQKKKRSRAVLLFSGLCIVLLVLQVVMAVILAYSDGDDAYYVAVSTLTENSETMYLKNPYTFGGVTLDYRRVLAPFPIWVAFLSKISGIRTAAVAHVAVSVSMILMGNMILYLIAGKLFKEGRKYLFFLFAEMLVLFSDYSMYTAERFLISRSRQGKAALGAIVIPMIFFLFLNIAEFVRNNKKIPKTYWFLFICVQIAGLLCSTQGTVLCCLLTVMLGGFLAGVYKRFKIFLPFILSCLPAFIVMGIYFLKTR